MLTSEIKEGNRISIIVNNLDFDSEIQMIREDFMLITIIVIGDKILKFPPGIRADMVYYAEENNLFIWENVDITPVRYRDGRKYHKINMPREEGKKYNRRSDYRLYVGRNMNVELRKGTERYNLRTTIKDVSATGFAFVNNQDYDIGTRVVLHYEIEKNNKIGFAGKIVRKQYMENMNTNVYGCLFNEPSDVMRKMINEEQQRKMREKMR